MKKKRIKGVGRRRREELFIDTSYQPRKRILFFRVSETERDYYQTCAKQQGVSLSEFLRKRLNANGECDYGKSCYESHE